MTEEEYIEFESGTEARHEYINGVVRRMPDQSGLNSNVKSNLLMLLFPKLKKEGYRVLSSVIKLRIPNQPVYLYPDVFITNEPVPDIYKEHLFTTAALVAKIYSGVALAFDTIDKFIYYRQIPEMHYYLLIEAEKKKAYLFRKIEPNEWTTDVFIQPTDVVHLPLLDIRFELKDLFE